MMQVNKKIFTSCSLLIHILTRLLKKNALFPLSKINNTTENFEISDQINQKEKLQMRASRKPRALLSISYMKKNNLCNKTRGSFEVFLFLPSEALYDEGLSPKPSSVRERYFPPASRNSRGAEPSPPSLSGGLSPGDAGDSDGPGPCGLRPPQRDPPGEHPPPPLR